MSLSMLRPYDLAKLDTWVAPADANGCRVWSGALHVTKRRSPLLWATEEDGGKTSHLVHRLIFERETGQRLKNHQRLYNLCGTLGCCTPAHHSLEPLSEIISRGALLPFLPLLLNRTGAAA
jgi:hypothetical protein